MKSAVFDTNVLIRFSQRDPIAQDALLSYQYRYISIVTYVEFLIGVALPQDEQSRQFMTDLFDIVETDREIFEMALTLRRAHKRKLKLPDALIYGTAKHLDMPLITFDKHDFDAGYEKSDIIVLS